MKKNVLTLMFIFGASILSRGADDYPNYPVYLEVHVTKEVGDRFSLASIFGNFEYVESWAKPDETFIEYIFGSDVSDMGSPIRYPVNEDLPVPLHSIPWLTEDNTAQVQMWCVDIEDDKTVICNKEGVYDLYPFIRVDGTWFKNHIKLTVKKRQDELFFPEFAETTYGDYDFQFHPYCMGTNWLYVEVLKNKDIVDLSFTNKRWQSPWYDVSYTHVPDLITVDDGYSSITCHILGAGETEIKVEQIGPLNVPNGLSAYPIRSDLFDDIFIENGTAFWKINEMMMYRLDHNIVLTYEQHGEQPAAYFRTFIPAQPITRKLVVKKAKQNISLSCPDIKTYGDAPFAITTSSDWDLPISYISSNPHVATVSDGNTVNIHGAGVVRLSAYNPGNSNILGDTASVELTVSKARQSITFPAIPNAHPGDKTVLQATSSSGLPVSYISSNDQVAEVSGNTLIIHDAGDVDIVAYQNGDENYSTAGNTKQRLRITKYPQEIVFNLPAKVFGDRPFVLDGASSSGLPVSYESSDTAIAVISGDILTLKGVGKALITAYQTGDEYYDMVTVTKALHVNRDTSTIIFPEIPVKACGDADFTLEARSSSGLPIYYKIDSSDDSKNSYVDSDAVAAISGNRVTIKAMGETTITAFQDDQDNLYNTTKFSRKLFVNKAPQSITFPAIPEKTYGVAPFLAGAQTNISGLTVAYESTNPQVATVSNGRITVHGAGTTDIIAYQDGNSQYRSDWARQTLTVKPATQRIAFPEPDRKTFGNSPFTLQAVSSSGLPVTFSSSNPQVATVTDGVVTIAGAGETQITAVQGGNSGYAPAAIITCTLTVNKAAQTVTDLPATMTRDGGVTTFNLPESTDFGLPITYESDNREVATIWNNTVTVHNAGTTRITATQAGNKNYEPMTKICDLTITKATQTIDFPEIPLKITGDAPFSLHAVSSMGLPVYYTSSNPSIASISNNSVVTVHGAGQIEITASQDGNGRCLPAETKQTLSVNRASENITFPEIPVKAYGDASFNLGVRSSSGVSYVVSNQDVVTVSDSGDAVVKGVGTSLVTAYSAGEVIIRTLTVTKATQTLTFPVIPVKTYGDAAFVPGATGSSGLPVTYESSNPLVAEILNDMVTITGVGTAVITARQAGDDHYESAQLSRTLTVNAASQVITFPEISGKTYGDAPFSLHASSNVGQLFYVSSNPQTAIVSDEGEVTVTGAGTSVITVRGLNMDGTLDAVTRTLTVNKAFQTITFPEIPVKTYGIHPFNLQATSSSGLSVSYESSNPQVASIWNSTVTIHSAGTTRITASQAGNENYNPSDKVSRTLVVEKEPLYLLLDETSVRSSGDFVPVRAYVGFKDGDDESVLDELPVIRRDENSDSPWYILVGGSDDNYEYYISYDGRTGFDMPGKGSVRVYSTANRIGIVSDEAIRSVDLIDLTGRVLLHRLFDKSAVEIPVDNCPQGQYLLRVTLQSGRTEVRKTVRN